MSHKVFKSGLLLFAVLLSMLAAGGNAQTLSANLSGFVNDPDGAVIPNAAVVLINQASKDKRTTKSNGSGFFTFTAVPAGTYTVEVQHAGFSSFVEHDIELHPSDSLTLTDVKLPVGNVDTTVTVTAAASTIVNQGEKSVIITAEDIKRLPVQGRDVTELIKTLPGFAMTAQGTGADNLGPNSDTVGGQTQNYTANGASSQGVQILSDGVNITDPGNGAGSDQVINMDNVAEVKVQTSNFGADSAKGPIVINAVGKSGGSTYHGELYIYGRTNQLNTQDWFSKFDGDAKPKDREIYPGGNIGGPVRIPGTDFNHNRRLTFFVSGEDYAQKNEYAYGNSNSATIYALVPTQAMRNGDFSAQSLAAYFGPGAPQGAKLVPSIPVPPPNPLPQPANGTSNYYLPDCSPNGSLALYVNICNVPGGQTPGNGQLAGQAYITNGQIPTAQFDPGTQAILNNLIPLPNTPTFTSNNGGVTTNSQGQVTTFQSIYNYKQVNLVDDASYQARARMDYAFSDSTKLYGSYNFQHSNGRNPQQLYYSPQTNFGDVNTPGGILGQDFSHVASLNFTKVFTQTLTNELFAGASLNLSGNEIGKKGANLSSAIGYPAGYQINGSLPGTKPSNAYPELYDYGYDGLPLGLFPDYSSPIFQRKFTPSGGDNLTKVIKTHTIKVGVYVERDENNETDLNVASNGQIENYYDGPNNAPGNIQQPDGTLYNSPGNYLASFFLGQVSAFQQYNFQTNSNLYYWNVAAFATDSWKANKKLTLDYGLRFDHMGPWQDAHGIGFAVFSPALYNQQVTVGGGSISVVKGVLNPGFTWHAVNSSIPNSGAGSTLFFYSPRFGIAYDMFGDGKTFFRGGFGAYRSHDGWNDVNQAQATAQGQAVALVGGGGVMLRNVGALAAAGHFSTANTSSQSGTSGVGFGLQQGDTEQPLTYTYSFTVDQQINPTTLFELSYQGSQTKHLLTQYEQGAAGDLENINAIPIGTLFHPDPITGTVNSPQGFAEGQGGSINDFRPYAYYSQVNIARHVLYSNYNGLQVSLRKTQGRLLYAFNYTWSKDLGVLGSYSTGNVVDSTNIRPNYQPLAQDRSHVVNSTFSYDTGKFRRGNNFVKAFLSSYDISGIINFQSGPNIQRVLNSNLNLSGQVSAQGSQNPYNTFPINNTNILGTPDVVLQPNVTCPLTRGLPRGQHRYINGGCLGIPAFGVNGPAEYPYIHGPAYFNFDARISRQINLKGQRNLQFQLSGFNVINRPNYSFSSKYPLEQTLYYTGTTLAGAKAPSQFGQASYRFGRRVTEISIKYNF